MEGFAVIPMIINCPLCQKECKDKYIQEKDTMYYSCTLCLDKSGVTNFSFTYMDKSCSLINSMLIDLGEYWIVFNFEHNEYRINFRSLKNYYSGQINNREITPINVKNVAEALLERHTSLEVFR
jgi:hypothetical protein